MQSPEDRWGYALCALLVLAGIAFAAVHGKGSPKHPSPLFPSLGAALAAVVAYTIWRYRNRFASGMLAVVAALLVNLARPPNSLLIVYYLVLIGPLAWAVWLTMRQTKATRALAASQPRAPAGQRGAGRQTGNHDGKKRGRGGEPVPERRGPAPSGRYTPPQSGPRRRSRKELAAAAAPDAAKAKRRGRSSEKR